MQDTIAKPTPAMNAVKFSIGIKLVTIITILMLLSLGAITVLVSIMVSQDVRVTAEDNNFTVNRRSAGEAESSLRKTRSGALVLLETLNAAGTGGALPRQAAAFFFERNQDVAAIAVADTSVTAGADFRFDQLLVNTRFFASRELDSSLVDAFFAERREELARAAKGETILLNAAARFSIPVLALFIPWGEGGVEQAAAIVFSSEELGESFGTGTNQSYLINGDGDILVHGDYELVKAGANVANRKFVQTMRERTEQSLQMFFTDEEGVRHFGAFTKLDIAGAAVITTIEYDTVFEGIAATTRRNAYLTAAVLFAAILLIWFFSKSISNPLRLLAAAAVKIEGGAFKVDISPRSRDEIGLLTSSFRRMGAALEIFGRFTNRDIAVRAMRGEIRPGGLPKHGTIFFSDIRGFTEKSENFTKAFGDKASDLIVMWLNAYLTRMVECVEKTGGAVDKFIGDAVMAHWGTAYTAGSPQEDAFSCVRAALMMRDVLAEMNTGRDGSDPANPPIHIGCGINSGIVTAGQIGSDLRMEYTVIGDPVNLASRTEALNKPMGTDILITEYTWELVRDRIIYEEMPPVTVKGKAQPVRLFAVINIRAAEGEVQTGFQTLAEVREMLGIEAPDLAKVNTGKEEKKYKIGTE